MFVVFWPSYQLGPVLLTQLVNVLDKFLLRWCLAAERSERFPVPSILPWPTLADLGHVEASTVARV